MLRPYSDVPFSNVEGLLIDEIEVAPAPPQTPNGAHDRGDGTVTFALWAPWKSSVHLIGDFNNWDPTADPLAVDQDGLWWIEKQLGPGTHAYQFVLDGGTT